MRLIFMAIIFFLVLCPTEIYKFNRVDAFSSSHINYYLSIHVFLLHIVLCTCTSLQWRS